MAEKLYAERLTKKGEAETANPPYMTLRIQQRTIPRLNLTDLKIKHLYIANEKMVVDDVKNKNYRRTEYFPEQSNVDITVTPGIKLPPTNETGFFDARIELNKSKLAEKEIAKREAVDFGVVSDKQYQREDQIKAVEKQYGAEVYNWQDFWTEIPGAQYLRKMFKDLAASDNKYGISAKEFFCIAIGEGLYYWFYSGLRHNHPDDKEFAELVQKDDRIVNGFGGLGTDHFYTEAPKLKQRGWLPHDFNDAPGKDSIQVPHEMESRKYSYGYFEGSNEFHVRVQSAYFRSVKDALIGFKAVYENARTRFLDDWQQMNLPAPNDDQMYFWTYVYFQRPEGHDLINKGTLDFNDKKKFNLNKTSINANVGDKEAVFNLAYRRLVALRGLEVQTDD